MNNSPKSFSVRFEPKVANLETLNQVVAYILKLEGCTACGRLAELNLTFQGDPPSELARVGVTAIEVE